MTQSSFDELRQKMQLVCTAFEPLISLPITRYQTAEVQRDDGSWSPWPDLPVRIYAGDQALVSIAWSCFDTLWLSNDLSVPFDISWDTVRWVDNGIPEINDCLSRAITGVSIGSSEVTFAPNLNALINSDSNTMAIWPNLLIHLNEGHLQVFNNLDENAYSFHHVVPDGTFLKCL